MSITQQQARALEALERVYYATHASFIDRNLVRQYIEQGAAPGADVVMREARETLLIAAANFGNLAPSARDRCIRSANALFEAYTSAAVQHPQQEQSK